MNTDNKVKHTGELSFQSFVSRIFYQTESVLRVTLTIFKQYNVEKVNSFITAVYIKLSEY